MSDNLFRYVEEGDIKSVLEILKAGGKEGYKYLNEQNENRIYALHIAAAKGNAAMTGLLLTHNAKVGCMDDNHLTPLHYAARGGHKEVLLELLKQNAQVGIQTAQFWTPLHFATFHRHTEIVKILCEHKANLEETDLKSQTALHIACSGGYKDIVEILLNHEAKVHTEDSEHQTALELLQIRRPSVGTMTYSENNYFEALSRDMRSLFYNNEYSDITFVFDSPTVEKIPAHRVVLKARAPSLLKDVSKEVRNQMIRIPGMSCTAFRLMLEWIYSATIDIDEVDLDVAIELYNKATDYQLPRLKAFVENLIISNIDETTAKTVLEVATSFKADPIIQRCSTYIIEHFNKIVEYHRSTNSLPVFTKDELLEIIHYVDIIEGEVPPVESCFPVLEGKVAPEITNLICNEPADPQASATFSSSGGVLKVKIPRPPATRANPRATLTPAATTTTTTTTTKKNTRTVKTAGGLPPEKIEKPEKPEKEKIDLVPVKTEKFEPLEKKPTGNETEMSGRTLELCQKLITQLMDDLKAPPFNIPVDPEVLLIPQYPLIIKHPMDLGTIKSVLLKNRARDRYKSLKEFASKVRLVFDNARTFNQSGSSIYNDADYLSKLFESKYLELQKTLGLPKSYDPPKEFVPPAPVGPIVDIAPVPRRKESTAVDPKKAKRRTQSNPRQTSHRPAKKRKTSEADSKQSPSQPVILLSEKTQLHESLMQLMENESAMTKVMTLISPSSNTGEMEIDVASLPANIIRKLQQFVKEVKNNPQLLNADSNTKGMDTLGVDSDEDDDNDSDYK